MKAIRFQTDFEPMKPLVFTCKTQRFANSQSVNIDNLKPEP